MEYKPVVNKLQEEDLYRWWQYYARSGKTIYSQGRRLRVFNSGVLNTCRGPDFTSARFELDGIVYQGDVECHRKTSDWYAHHHHLDKLYRQVVLHLVGRPDDSAAVTSQWCQQPICTVPLPEPLAPADAPERYCQPTEAFHRELKSNLIKLALARFDHKINFFIKALNTKNDEALFYIFFFRGLGYPANANTFQLLAEQLDWTWLMQYQTVFVPDYRVLFAVCAGLSGFIEPECQDSYTRHIKDLYQTYKYILPGHTIESPAWQYAGVRFHNHPHFRLAAGLQILHYYHYNMFDTLTGILQERKEYFSALKDMFALFQLQPELYWQTHYALGKERKKTIVSTSMGKARIIELLINVVLPLAAAKASLSGSEGFLAYLQSLYLSLPLVSTYGSFQKNSGWFDTGYKIWPAQAVNQSLILLQADYCRLSLCRQCPVKRRPSGNNGKIIDNKIKNI
ncbi:MAG: DUF2851 family protein [Calditrichaceae bacterium]|nr:DUF2851 family protein [Calditrichaceae bacterium]